MSDIQIPGNQQMVIKVDFSEVQEGFDPIPAGVYTGRCEKIEYKTGKDSGIPYLNYTFQITGPKYEGRKLWYVNSLGNTSLWKVKETFTAFGLEGGCELHVDESSNLVTNPEFFDAEVGLEVVDDEYRGQKRGVINRVYKLEGTATTSLPFDIPL